MKLMNLSLTMDPACLNPSGDELAIAISVHYTHPSLKTFMAQL